jgi:hypothetical protein
VTLYCRFDLEGCKATRRTGGITATMTTAWREQVGLEGVISGSDLLGICLYETSDTRTDGLFAFAAMMLCEMRPFGRLLWQTPDR